LAPALCLLLALVAQAFPARANNEIDEYLVGPGGSGGTTSISHSGGYTSTYLGNVSSVDYHVAQSFRIASGVFSQFSLQFNTNGGTPTGTATWILSADNAGIPNNATPLATGTLTPAGSSTVTVNVSDGPFLDASQLYWLYLKSTAAQTLNNYWQIYMSTGDSYVDGRDAVSSSTDSSFSVSAIYDIWATFTTVAGQAPADMVNDQIAQSFFVGTQTVVTGVKLNLKKSGTPAGTLTASVYTNLANGPSGILISADATATVAESSLATSYGLITFTFAHAVTLVPGVKYILALTTDRTDTINWVAWGAASFCGTDGSNMIAHIRGAWQPLTTTALWEFVVSDITLPATAAATPPAIDTYYPLSSSNFGLLRNEVSTGEAMNFGTSLFVVGLLIFIAFILLVRRS
jgi:hypothetical protein